MSRVSLLSTLFGAWKERKNNVPDSYQNEELDFLPSALEILERPPSPGFKILGFTIISLFTFSVIWACIGEVDIVAVAEGKVVSSSRIKEIQPLDKGVVKAVYVKEGQMVKKGDPLVELDGTSSLADQIRIENDLRFSQIEKVRKTLLFNALNSEYKEPDLSESAIGLVLTSVEESGLRTRFGQEWIDFQARLNLLESQKKERESIAKANKAQISQLEQTLPLVSKQAQSLKELASKNLVSETQYVAVERDRIEQQQLLETYKAQQQQYQSAIETAHQTINALVAETLQQTNAQIEELERKVVGLSQELAKAKDIRSKQILYAPVDGRIQQLMVHTIGGVVSEAQVLMNIVPKDDYLELEATLENKDIGFVFEGQDAEVKINTFNFTKYGVIDAEVINVTPDAVIDEVKGLVYKLRLKMHKSSMQVNGRQVELLPGMAATAEVKTGKRRIIEYVISPLLRFKNESIKER